MTINELTPILSIETSDELCSTAIMLEEDSFAEINFQKKFVHSEKLMPMISDLLKNADLKLDDVKTLAVSMGPGSFTGLRIGLTIAKGLSVGNNLPIIPVPTFDALAFQLSSYLPMGTRFSIANNANINEIYFAKYIVTENRFEVLNEATLKDKIQLPLLQEDGDLLFGNYANRKKDFKTSSPNAWAVAKWAYIFGKDLVTFDHDLLEPNYLKNFIVKEKNEPSM
ncbi:MAG: tRNA (adenosine(37)-N6)-threonylcarbamoyltransferase complex dimerization subunit type 1 TsaB [Melioribacteraceae bacterium]|nr:tRNA (adenosine(37)-N6)-threonylcarbamoyltransferase complex dimerization subunit type 1 TsaB [Melioribacteraceae bacterium]